MNLVFCMAGVYRRFREAGYATPKFLLPWRGTTILEEIIRQILGTNPIDSPFRSVCFVANERDQSWHEQLVRVLNGFKIPSSAVRYVQDTPGQAATALLAGPLLRSLRGEHAHDEPVVFHNIDTILIGRDFDELRRTLQQVDGYIDVFDADSPSYSFVQATPAGRVTEIVEKKVISRHATTGLYAFASWRLYETWAAQTTAAGNEFYISDVYKRMLNAGLDIRMNTSSTDHQTIILGTPTEYEALATVPEVRLGKSGLGRRTVPGDIT